MAGDRFRKLLVLYLLGELTARGRTPRCRTPPPGPRPGARGAARAGTRGGGRCGPSRLPPRGRPAGRSPRAPVACSAYVPCCAPSPFFSSRAGSYRSAERRGAPRRRPAQIPGTHRPRAPARTVSTAGVARSRPSASCTCGRTHLCLPSFFAPTQEPSREFKSHYPKRARLRVASTLARFFGAGDLQPPGMAASEVPSARPDRSIALAATYGSSVVKETAVSKP